MITGGRIPSGKSRLTYMHQKQFDFQHEYFQKMAYNCFEFISIGIIMMFALIYHLNNLNLHFQQNFE